MKDVKLLDKESTEFKITKTCLSCLSAYGTRRVFKNVFKAYAGVTAGPLAPVVMAAVELGGIGFGASMGTLTAHKIDQTLDSAADLICNAMDKFDEVKSKANDQPSGSLA